MTDKKSTVEEIVEKHLRLENEMVMESVNGSPRVEYRACDGKIERRATLPDGTAYRDTGSPWVVQTDAEIRDITRMDTPLSRWIVAREEKRLSKTASTPKMEG